jgi:hypothetical protein
MAAPSYVPGVDHTVALGTAVSITCWRILLTTGASTA